MGSLILWKAAHLLLEESRMFRTKKIQRIFIFILVSGICYSTGYGNDESKALELFHNKQYKESLSYFKNTLAAESAVPNKSLFVKYGIALIETKKYQDAVDILSTGISQYPRTRNANYNLGLAYYWQGNIMVSRTYFIKETRVNPKNPRAYFMYGYVSGRLGDDSLADRYMQKGVNMDPSSEMMSGVYNGYLTTKALQWMEKDPRKSLKYAQKAEKYFKNNVKTYEILSALYFQMGRYADSVKACGQLVKLKPEIGFYHNNLANALLYEGKDIPRAKAEIEKAIERSPDMLPFFQDTMSWAEYKLGNREKALELLRQLEENADKEGLPLDMKASVYYHLGEIYKNSKEYSKAKEYYRKALSLKVNSLESSLADKALKKIK